MFKTHLGNSGVHPSHPSPVGPGGCFQVISSRVPCRLSVHQGGSLGRAEGLGVLCGGKSLGLSEAPVFPPSGVGEGLTGEAAGSGPVLTVCPWKVRPWEAHPVHPSCEGGTGPVPVHSPGRQLVRGDLLPRGLPGGDSTSLPLCPGRDQGSPRGQSHLS